MGRGDKVTDMHFIADHLHQPGQFQPGVSIILHPFGRHCLGFQLAGGAHPFWPSYPLRKDWIAPVRRVCKNQTVRSMDLTGNVLNVALCIAWLFQSFISLT